MVKLVLVARLVQQWNQQHPVVILIYEYGEIQNRVHGNGIWTENRRGRLRASEAEDRGHLRA
jgi:hypothetical protein